VKAAVPLVPVLSSPSTSNFRFSEFLSGFGRGGIFCFSIKLFHNRNFNYFPNAFLIIAAYISW
jgi:hypothetical protein